MITLTLTILTGSTICVWSLYVVVRLVSYLAEIARGEG